LEKQAQTAKDAYYTLALGFSTVRHEAAESIKDKLQ